jgi:hypothetical protein
MVVVIAHELPTDRPVDALTSSLTALAQAQLPP